MALMTIEEFGKRIKEKYPEYDGFSDSEVGSKVLSQYPQYKNIVQPPTFGDVVNEGKNMNVPVPEESREKGIAPLGFFEGQQQLSKEVATGVGKGILSTFRGASSLGEKFLRGALKGGLKFFTPKSKEEEILGKFGIVEDEEFETGAEKLIPEELVTPEGTAQKIGFTAEQIAEFFIPGGQISKLKKGAGLLKRGAIEGAAFAGQSALQEGEINETVKNAGIIGLASPLVGKVFGAIKEQIKFLPDRFIRSALGRSKKEILKDLTKNPKKTLSQFVLKTKKPKTANSLILESKNTINKLNSQIESNLKKVNITQNKVSTKKILDKVTQDINKAGGSINLNEARDIINKLAPQAKGLFNKPTMSLSNANNLRKSIDKTLGDRGFLTSQVPFNKDVLRRFTNILREDLKQKVPKNRKLFEEFANEIQFRDALLDKVSKKLGNQVLSFGDFIGGGLGGIFGGGLPGAVAGVTARRVIESVPFKIGSAKMISQFNEILNILSKVPEAQRGSIVQILRQRSSSTEPTDTQEETLQ